MTISHLDRPLGRAGLEEVKISLILLGNQRSIDLWP